MLAALTPSHPPTWSRSTRRHLSKKKPFSYIDILYLRSRLKAHCFGLQGNRSTDMPKKNEKPSPKSHKSSNTRDSSTLAVRQASGTQTDGSSRSQAQRDRGGSDASTASHRSQAPSNYRPRGHASPPPNSTAAVDSAGSRLKASPGAKRYIENYIEYRKALFIKIFMEKVGEWLDEKVCSLEEAYDNNGGESSSGSGSSGAKGVKRVASAGKLVPGKKRQNRGGADDEDCSESDDRRGGDSNQKRAKKDTDDDRRRLACPFFKYDRQRYQTHRSCCGPGWTEIHRLKEHLYRHHRVYTCVRCLEHFKTDSLLQKHLRAMTMCPVKDEKSHKVDPGDGFGAETQKQLKNRNLSKQSEADRWYDVYHILFPGHVKDENLPSPWYDNPNEVPSPSDLRRFLRRELPSIVRRELEAEVDQSFQDVGPAMMRRLSTMIRDSAAKLSRMFENIPTAAEAAAQEDPETARGSSRAGSPTTTTTTAVPPGTTAADQNLGDMNFVGDLADCSFDDLDWGLNSLEFGGGVMGMDQGTGEWEDFGGYESFAPPQFDSAYESGSLGSSGTRGT